MTTAVKTAGRKLTERKFAVPGSAGILALANDAAGLGFDFRTIALFCALSLGYAAVEAWVDVTRLNRQK